MMEDNMMSFYLFKRNRTTSIQNYCKFSLWTNGCSQSPICLQDVVASTTSVGRMLLNFAKWFSEVKFPDLDNYDPDYKVVECESVYGDTDSVFLNILCMIKMEINYWKESIEVAIQKVLDVVLKLVNI